MIQRARSLASLPRSQGRALAFYPGGTMLEKIRKMNGQPT